MTLAWLVAVLAAFVSLDLVGRAAKVRNSLKVGWLVGAALGLGTGIWSVNVISLAAEPLPLRPRCRW